MEFFEKLGIKGVKASEKEVPESLFGADRETVIGFLRGLFSADGTIGIGKNKTRYIRLTSKSPGLLKGVQKLLINLGIFSRIYNRQRNRRVVFEYKNKRGELRLYESDGTLFELQVSKDCIPVFLEKVGFMCNKHKEKIERLRESRFYKREFEDRVLCVEKLGKEKVYDVTEPLTHSFVANGIVIHNCGEQPLLPYEPCNLGSINLSKFVALKEGKMEFDWERLKQTIYTCIHFLDNVIDINNFPLPEIERISKMNRRIGLGVMGWAESLVKLGIKYDSEEAVEKAEQLMKFINDTALEASCKLAEFKGVFPNFKDSIYDKDGEYFYDEDARPRNCARTTIAPTGTIAIAAGLQGSGIEPFFAIAYKRYTAEGIDALKKGETPKEEHTFFEVNPLFREVAEKNDYFGLGEAKLFKKISDNHGSVRGIEEVPKKIQDLFAVAHDVPYEFHVKIQAAFQKHIDNAVSKTINMANSATVDDIKKVYQLAYEWRCKGITIYRDGCKAQQVLNLTGKAEKKEEKKEEFRKRLFEEVGEKGGGAEYYEIKTGYGPLHIHIDYTSHGPYRVFTNMTPIGTEISGLTSALGIIISKYLEIGGDPKVLIKHLNSVKGDRPYGFGRKRVDSIPHGIAIALRNHLIKTGKMESVAKERSLKDFEEVEEEKVEEESLKCPQCGSANVEVMGGCHGPTCFDCGYSECS